MTQQERLQLNRIIEELESVQHRAPDRTSYVEGRTSISIAYHLLSIIRDLKAMTDDGTTETGK